MKQACNVIFMCFIVLLYGCNKTLSPKEYIEFFTSDKNAKTIQVSSIKYVIKYIPTDYFALNESISDENINYALFNKRKNEICDNLYFIIEIDNFNKGLENKTKEEEILYYQEYVKSNIKLYTSTDSFLTPSFVNYEDYYNLKNCNKLLICFDKTKISNYEYLKLVYDDDFNNFQNIQATFTKFEINNFPKLKI